MKRNRLFISSFKDIEEMLFVNTANEKINIYDAVLAAAKTVLVSALVFAVIYGLNAVMSDFVEKEEAENAAQRALEMEWLRIQEDYDFLQDVNLAFADITCHYDGQFLELFEKHVNAEYIFIGTSHFTHGVTPEEFEVSGKRFFNFALNGSNPSYYTWWYNDVFKANNYVKPKAIIFGVNWFMFDTNWLWRRPEFDFEYYLNRVPAPTLSDAGSESEVQEVQRYRYTGAWYDVDAIVTYVTGRFPVLSSRERFIELILPEPKEEREQGEFMLERRERGQKEAAAARYGARERCRLDLFYKGFAPYENEFHGHHAGVAGTTFFEAEFTAFVNLVGQFQSEGIPVIFVMAPEFLPGRDAPQFDEMLEMIERVAREKNIPFLNYNTALVSEINSDHTLYSDWGHLNTAGAHVYSRKLYEDLNRVIGFE
jgi:hypothetical protein